MLQSIGTGGEGDYALVEGVALPEGVLDEIVLDEAESLEVELADEVLDDELLDDDPPRLSVL